MIMKKTRQTIVIVLLLLVSFVTSMSMAQDMQMIPVDPAVRIGKLDCGLTYYIRHNDYPENRVNFYIAQRVGSIQEEESQRGLAHFLEHMAFNGSEHFNGEGKGVIDYTRSLGVDFGRDLNAYTSIAETVYNINDVPSTRQSAIDSCLLILKDWSNGLLLTDEEIDKERGVIHEEWRLGQGPEMRMYERQLEKLYPGSKYGSRFPIGLMSVVDNFEYKELRNYYHKWYRPDNQALVIVGDVDVDHIEAQIKEMYKGYTLDPNAAQVVDEPVPDNDAPIIVIDKDKEQQYNHVTVMFKHDAIDKEEKSNINYMVIDYVKSMIYSMFAMRFEEKTQEEDCPFISAYAYDGEYLFSSTKDAFTLYCVPKEGQTEAATQSLITEGMRAAKFGFTPTEYDRARDEYLSRLEKQNNERDKVYNNTYGRQYCSHYLDNEPIPSVEQRYQIMNMIAPNITVEMINQALPEFIGNGDKNLVVMNFNQEKDGAVYPTEEGLLAAINAGRNADIQAYVDNTKQEPLMSTMPKKGKIVKESENTVLGYKELELSNGARVILKKTDFKQDEIRMNSYQRGGKSLYGKEDFANFMWLDAKLSQITGLGDFSATDVEKALYGKQVYAYQYCGPYTDQLYGGSTVKDLETLFQLIYLRFTAASKDEKKYNQYKGYVETMIKNKYFEPEAVLQDTIEYLTSNHHWRNKPYTIEDLNKVDYDRVVEIAKERTANAANYTFTFVGSFDEAIIRQYIEQYIASLPAKKGAKPNWKDDSSIPMGQTVKHFTQKMEAPKAYEVISWLDESIPYSLENAVKAQILGDVLSRVYLQKIREDAGAAYSTFAYGNCGRSGDKTTTSVVAICPVNPDFKDVALQILNEEMVKAGSEVDATAVKEAQEKMLKDHVTEIKENYYWLNNIQQYLIYGIDDITGYEQVVKSQTPESIAAFARQILSAGNKVEVVMTPEQ